MDYPTSRKAAIAAKSSKYFTGKPCVNGHTSYRYTVSGTCVLCIHPPANVNATSQRGERFEQWAAVKLQQQQATESERERRKARQLAKKHLRVFRLGHLPGELHETFTAAVWAATALRYPAIELDDVRSAGALSWRCHPEDKRALDRLSVSMRDAFYNTPEHQTEIALKQRANEAKTLARENANVH